MLPARSPCPCPSKLKSADTTKHVGGLSNWQEAVDGALVPLSGVKISGDATKQQDVVLSGVKLDDQVPVRLFLADVKP